MSWVTTEICWYFHYSCCSKHLTSHACALLIDNVGNYLYIYLNNGSFKSEVDPHQFNLRERKKIFKSWQVCDWLAKWLIVLGFMDLRWPRVYRRSNVGLVFYILAFLPHGWGKMPLGGVLPHMQGCLAPIYRGVLPPPIIFPQTGVITSKHFALLHRWLTRLSARLQWLQCVSNGVTAVLHKASNICMNISYRPQNYHSRINSRRHCLLIINDWMHSTQFTRMYITLLCSLFNSK